MFFWCVLLLSPTPHLYSCGDLGSAGVLDVFGPEEAHEVAWGSSPSTTRAGEGSLIAPPFIRLMCLRTIFFQTRFNARQNTQHMCYSHPPKCVHKHQGDSIGKQASIFPPSHNKARARIAFTKETPRRGLPARWNFRKVGHR